MEGEDSTEQGSSELSILGLSTRDEETGDTAGAGDNVMGFNELSMMMIIPFLI